MVFSPDNANADRHTLFRFRERRLLRSRWRVRFVTASSGPRKANTGMRSGVAVCFLAFPIGEGGPLAVDEGISRSFMVRRLWKAFDRQVSNLCNANADRHTLLRGYRLLRLQWRRSCHAEKLISATLSTLGLPPVEAGFRRETDRRLKRAFTLDSARELTDGFQLNTV